jgi:hypothetical protein
MPQDTGTTTPQTSLPTIKRASKTLHREVGRLRVLAELYTQSLRDEFYFDSAIQQEWAQKMLPELRAAGYPLGQYLENQGQCSDSPRLNASIEEWAYFDREVESAIETVLAADPVAAIGGALEHVNRAVHRLLMWQRQLASADESGATDAEEIGVQIQVPALDLWEAAAELDALKEEFRKAITAGDPLEICRASRSLFLLGYSAQKDAPTAWLQRRDEVIRLHQQALERLLPGTDYHRNTRARLEKLIKLTPEEYERDSADYSRRAA